ncbi:MAG: NAD(P)/FAD-dependent oxidoreductase [Alphaproteobacteria bacterium]
MLDKTPEAVVLDKPVAAPSPTRLKTQIVVVGGGAGGLALVRKLGAYYGRDEFDIILVERNHTHIWKPLLHEVAAGSLDANLDEVGYRSHGHRWGYRFFLGSLEAIDREKRQVILAPIKDTDGTELIARHTIRYDYLVLAIGAVSNDFGIPGVRQNCLFLDDRTGADRFRQKLLNHCLRVSRALSVDASVPQTVDIAIIGGGATGVELAAELFNAASALGHYGLEVFDESCLRVTLIEAGPRLLPALPEKLAEAAKEELEQLGVTVLTGTTVTEVTTEGVVTSNGVIKADLRVWAAGVRGPDVLKEIGGLETNRNNQLMVRPDLRTTRDDRIYALGDCCCFIPEGETKPVPPRAQAAHQMAGTVLANIKAAISGGTPQTFIYRDKGSLVSLSRFSTVGSLMGNLIGGRMAIEGRIARLVYVSLYRMHLFAVHGWLKGMTLVAIGHVNQIVRPRLKLH